MCFEYYPWQEKQLEMLLCRWRADTFPHGLLLTGPKGLGKFSFARTLSSRFLCQNATLEMALPCGACQSCRWLLADTHPDLFIVQPESASAFIKIEQIRQLLCDLQQTAHLKQQIVIVEPAEAMNSTAANALLKTLEEPIGTVIFWLISHQPHHVSASLSSRCQKIAFPVPSVMSTLQWLQNQLPTHSNCTFLLSLAGGIPLRALALGQQSQLIQHETLISQFLHMTEGTLSPMALSANCLDIPWVNILDPLYLLLLDIVRIQHGVCDPLIHIQHIEALTKLATRMSVWQTFSFLDSIVTTKKQLNTTAHLNLLLLWESLFSEWVSIISQ